MCGVGYSDGMHLRICVTKERSCLYKCPSASLFSLPVPSARSFSLIIHYSYIRTLSFHLRRLGTRRHPLKGAAYLKFEPSIKNGGWRSVKSRTFTLSSFSSFEPLQLFPWPSNVSTLPQSPSIWIRISQDISDFLRSCKVRGWRASREVVTWVGVKSEQ
jgi:hypothetical protein